MSLFWRKRSIQIQAKVIKDQNPTETPSEINDIFEGVKAAAAYADIAKGLITHAALTIGGVYCVCKIVERICKNS